eukprot:6197825-Pleurochrysis_carterae.AAC.1
MTALCCDSGDQDCRFQDFHYIIWPYWKRKGSNSISAFGGGGGWRRKWYGGRLVTTVCLPPVEAVVRPRATQEATRQQHLFLLAKQHALDPCASHIFLCFNERFRVLRKVGKRMHAPYPIVVADAHVSSMVEEDNALNRTAICSLVDKHALPNTEFHHHIRLRRLGWLGKVAIIVVRCLAVGSRLCGGASTTSKHAGKDTSNARGDNIARVS